MIIAACIKLSIERREVMLFNPNQYRRYLGENIYSIRRSKSMSQDDIADKTDLDRSYISQIETGTANITINTLLKIGTALDITPSTILQLTEKKLKNASKS
jgi:transcriptional regulator with XRE-family HTH domain